MPESGGHVRGSPDDLRNTEEHVVGRYNTGDRMKVWGKLGAFWGGLWSLLFGSAFFFIPGIGPLIVFGPLVVWIVAALESAVVVGTGCRTVRPRRRLSGVDQSPLGWPAHGG